MTMSHRDRMEFGPGDTAAAHESPSVYSGDERVRFAVCRCYSAAVASKKPGYLPRRAAFWLLFRCNNSHLSALHPMGETEKMRTG
jgi:hypothetical protein